MSEPTLILNPVTLQRALTRIAHEIAERCDADAELALVGVQRGGVFLAERLGVLLREICGQPVPVGTLDVSMHRDDLGRQAAPTVHPTTISFDITGKTVVLVDDVLFSGRTTRAALDALNDFGRPKRSRSSGCTSAKNSSAVLGAFLCSIPYTSLSASSQSTTLLTISHVQVPQCDALRAATKRLVSGPPSDRGKCITPPSDEQMAENTQHKTSAYIPHMKADTDKC